MLEDLSAQVDSTESKLGNAMGKLKDFIKKSEGSYSQPSNFQAEASMLTACWGNRKRLGMVHRDPWNHSRCTSSGGNSSIERSCLHSSSLSTDTPSFAMPYPFETSEAVPGGACLLDRSIWHPGG